MLTRLIRLITISAALTAAIAAPVTYEKLELTIPGASKLQLRGADARQQILITAKSSAGALRDWTHEVAYEAKPVGIVDVRPNGLILPISDGHAVVTAKAKNALTVSTEVDVDQSKLSRPINFPTQLTPLF